MTTRSVRMHNAKWFVVAVSLLWLAAGCTRIEFEEPRRSAPDAEAVAVGFTMPGVFAELRPETRAGGVLPAGEVVRVVVYKAGSQDPADYRGENAYLVDAGSGSRKLVPCTVDDRGQVTGAGEELRLVPGIEYDIYAYTPVRPFSRERFDVNDIRDGDDFLSSKTTVTLASYSPAIDLSTLEHRCAMLDLEVVSDPTDPGVATLAGQRIAIEKYLEYPVGIYRLGASGVERALLSPDGSEPDDFGHIILNSFEQTTPTSFQAQRVVLPLSGAQKFKFTLEVLFNGELYTLQTPEVNVKFEAGKRYTWKLTCKRQGVTLSMNVTPWTGYLSSTDVGTLHKLQKPANSFMVKPGAAISIPVEKIGGGAISDVAGAKVIWQTRLSDRPVFVRPDAVRLSPTGDRILVEVDPSAAPGNALVAAVDASGVVQWSWHLWVTDYDPSWALDTKARAAGFGAFADPEGSNLVYTYGGDFALYNGAQSVIMACNLGDMSSSDGAPASQRGLYYQWGRKDPFPRGSLPMSNLAGDAYTPPPARAGANQTLGRIWPDVFYTDYTIGSWSEVDLSTTPATGIKSDYDPCPYGWRLPANGTWGGFTSGSFSVTSGGLIHNGVSGIRYKLTGHIDPSGGYNEAPTTAYLWSASADYSMQFSSGSSSVEATPQNRAAGYQVRCVQDAVEFPLGRPRVGTVAFSNIVATAVTVSCSMLSNGGTTVDGAGFVYSTTPNFDPAAGSEVEVGLDASSKGFIARLTGLTPGVPVYVRGYVRVDDGSRAYGEQASVTPFGAPEVTISPVTGVTHNSVNLSATVTSGGGESSAEYGFYYSSRPGFNPAVEGTKIKVGDGIRSYTYTLTGLTPGKAYYVKAYAFNGHQTGYSVEKPFTTQTGPQVLQPTVSNRRATSLTLTSSVTGNTAGLSARGFEYSTDADFPAGTTTSVEVGGTPLTGPFTADISGLEAGGTYYVRAWSQSVTGKTFSPAVPVTLLKMPEVTTGSVSNLIGNRATLSGQVVTTNNLVATDRGFEISKIPGFEPGTGTRVQVGPGMGQAGPFSAVVGELDELTDYYFRAYAVSSVGTAYGEQQAFGSAHNMVVGMTNLALRSSRFDFSWPADGSGQDRITSVMFYYGEEDVAMPTTLHTLRAGSGGTLSYTPSQVGVNLRYYTRVVLTDTYGNKLYSGVATRQGFTYTNYFVHQGREYEVKPKSDDSAPAAWAQYDPVISNLKATDDDGMVNSAKLATYGSITAPDYQSWFPALRKCVSGTTEFPDLHWFLPSTAEMALIRKYVSGELQNPETGAFPPGEYDLEGEYWTSNEKFPFKAYTSDGVKASAHNRTDKYKVRCIHRRK